MNYYYPYNPYPYAPPNWTSAGVPPTSAPPSSGAGNTLQFGTLNQTQLESMHYSHQPVYYPYPTPVMMTPQYYQPHAHMTAPPQPGAQPHPAQRERGPPMRNDVRRRTGPPANRERPQEPSEGHRENVHKPVRETGHGHPMPQSRTETPTAPHSREKPPVQHPPPVSTGYHAQSNPASMTMHPHAMGHYPYYVYNSPYPMMTVDNSQPMETGHVHHKPKPVVEQPESTPIAAQTPVHGVPHEKHDASPLKRGTTPSQKRRLPFVNPNTQTPIDASTGLSTSNSMEKSNSGSMKIEIQSSGKSSRPSSPPPSRITTKEIVDKTVSEVLGRNERVGSKTIISKTQRMELKTEEPSKKPSPWNQHPQERKIIDPSKGKYIPGTYKNHAHLQEPQSIIKPKDYDSSTRTEILKTVASVEKRVEEDKQVEEEKEEKVTEERNEVKKATPLILDPSTKRSIQMEEVVADVIKGTRVTARTLELDLDVPKSHPVSSGTNTPPTSSSPAYREEIPKETEREVKEVEDSEPEKEPKLALIQAKPETAAESKPQTPSRNIYSSSVLQEFKEKNKEALPDMAAGPWLEGSDTESSPKEPLQRRSSSKMGSRSNSLQGLGRRNSSSSNKASRLSKTDLDVFHVSSKKRIYSFEFLERVKDQSTDKPQFQESLFCMKDFDGPQIKRSGSDKWSNKRGGFDDRPKTSLSRSGSREWTKEVGRSSSGVRRASRQFSGQRGPDESKWAKSDINQVSPFSHNQGVGLHHTENRYVVGEIQSDDPEEEKRQKIFKGLLNKLTPSNFTRMFEKFTEVEITDPRTLKGLIDQIFDKALTETTFCPLYSDLCHLLTRKMPEFEEEGDKRKLTFRRLLLNKCQNEFEKGDAAVRAAEEAEAADASAMSAEERQARLSAAKKERMRSLGNMQFIGFLFKKGMLTEKIIHSCIVDLLREEVNPKPEDIECLCQLLTTVGELLPADNVMKLYFNRIERLSKSPKLETRHRFMLLDLIELKERNWVERREKEGPKKIEEIHRDAQLEQMAQNARNRNSSFRQPNYTERNARSSTWNQSSSRNSRPLPFNGHEEVKPLTRNTSLGRTSSQDISLRPSSIGAPKATMTLPQRSRSPSQTSSQQPIEEFTEETKRTPMSADSLTRRVKSLVTEFCSVKDMEEALRCIEELISEDAEKADILKNLLLCAIDIRGVHVEDRLKCITPILNELLSRDLYTTDDLHFGLQTTMASLPEVADDYPIAPTLIANLLGSLVSEDILSLNDVLDVNGVILGAGREGLKDEDTPLVDSGLAETIFIEALKQMKKEEQEPGSVRDAVNQEDPDSLLLFYPSYHRDDTDLSEVLQFLD